MSRKFLDYNPVSGLLTTTAFEDGRNIVKYEQDVSVVLDDCEKFRLDEDRSKKGAKEGFMHAAYVPDLVILEMLTKHGVNFYDKTQRKRVLELIEKEYPKCKTTHYKLA